MKILKVIALAGVMGAAAVSATDAQAFWGWGGPGWGNGNGFGDGFGDGSFNMSFSGRSNVHGSGYGNGYGYNAPYYGYGAPYGYAPYAAAPMVNEKGEAIAPRFPAPYAPFAPQAQVAPQAK